MSVKDGKAAVERSKQIDARLELDARNASKQVKLLLLGELFLYLFIYLKTTEGPKGTYTRDRNTGIPFTGIPDVFTIP